MRREFFVFLMAAAVVAAGCRKPQPRLEPFASEPGRFRVLLPGTPETRENAVETPLGRLTTHSFSITTEEASYSVVYADYPTAAIRKQGALAMLQGAADGMVQNVQGTLLSATDITEKAQPGKDVRFEVPQPDTKKNGIGRARIFLVGTRLYQALIVGEPAVANSPTANQILDSFTFTFANNEIPSVPLGPEPTEPAPKPATAAADDALPDDFNIVRSQHTLDELAMTEFAVPAKDVLRSMVWTQSGDSFYVLTAPGSLLRIDPHTLKLMKLVKLREQTQWLARSAQGLVVTLPAREQVWLLDPDSLEIKKRLSVLGVTRALSSPALSLLIAATGSGSDAGLSVLDLKSGALLRQYTQRDLKPADFSKAVVTPDGKYLFAPGPEQLLRFRIQGTAVTFDDLSPSLGSPVQTLEVSADSRYVAPLSGGERPAGGSAAAQTDATAAVYNVHDLRKPVVTVPTGAAPSTLSWDPKTGMIYTATPDTQLMVFRSTGTKVKDYRFGSAETRQLVASPDGTGLLLLTTAGLYHLTAPAERVK